MPSLLFVSAVNVTYSPVRGYPRQQSDWRTEDINAFGLIGPEDFLEQRIIDIRNELFERLFLTVCLSMFIIGIIMTPILTL